MVEPLRMLIPNNSNTPPYERCAKHAQRAMRTLEMWGGGDTSKNTRAKHVAIIQQFSNHCLLCFDTSNTMPPAALDTMPPKQWPSEHYAPSTHP